MKNFDLCQYFMNIVFSDLVFLVVTSSPIYCDNVLKENNKTNVKEILQVKVLTNA
jgi:hypothetical protein